jgi:hypothetical protein
MLSEINQFHKDKYHVFSICGNLVGAGNEGHKSKRDVEGGGERGRGIRKNNRKINMITVYDKHA